MILKQCGIYKIMNIITRDYYLGSAVNIPERWIYHRWKLRKNIHWNSHLQNAWNKYGEQAFEFSIILLCDREHKLYFEDGLIKLFKPAYNIAKDAKAPMQGRHHTEETRVKMGESMKGKNLGKRHTTETRTKISMAWKHRTPISEVTRTKMSKSAKGNTYALGYKHTTEARANMSESKKGKYPSEVTRAKLSKVASGELNHNFGKLASEETKQMMSETQKRRWAERKRLNCLLTNLRLSIIILLQNKTL